MELGLAWASFLAAIGRIVETSSAHGPATRLAMPLGPVEIWRQSPSPTTITQTCSPLEKDSQRVPKLQGDISMENEMNHSRRCKLPIEPYHKSLDSSLAKGIVKTPQSVMYMTITSCPRPQRCLTSRPNRNRVVGPRLAGRAPPVRVCTAARNGPR
jgi:hypothetical protein